MPLTIKVKARRYPLWHYAVAGLLALLGSAFWGWVAYIALGFALSRAWQVFFVFAGVQLLFLPIMYFAYERQFRDHSSRAVQKMASCFAASLAFAALYFIAQFPLGDTTVSANYHNSRSVDFAWRYRLNIPDPVRVRIAPEPLTVPKSRLR